MASSRRALLATALAAAGTAAAADSAVALQPSPDADLIRLCGHYVALDLEWLRLCDAGADLASGTPEDEAASARQSAVDDRFERVEAKLVHQTAMTPAGLLALARATRHSLCADAREVMPDLRPGEDGRMALALTDSVIRLLSGSNAQIANVGERG